MKVPKRILSVELEGDEVSLLRKLCGIVGEQARYITGMDQIPPAFNLWGVNDLAEVAEIREFCDDVIDELEY